MLVLSRKKNEVITIGDNITIVVIEIRGDKVRLGVEAPKDVAVHRREVYDAIKRGESRDGEQAAPPAAGEEPVVLAIPEVKSRLPSIGVTRAPLAHRVSVKP